METLILVFCLFDTWTRDFYNVENELATPYNDQFSFIIIKTNESVYKFSFIPRLSASRSSCPPVVAETGFIDVVLLLSLFPYGTRSASRLIGERRELLVCRF